jgi:hypothetical protein
MPKESLLPLPADRLELLNVIPLGSVPGTAEFSVVVIVQHRRDFEVPPTIVQKPAPSVRSDVGSV